MRRAPRVFAVALVVVFLATTARAQSPGGQGRFLALDFAGGVVPMHTTSEQDEDPWAISGWSVDATVRFLPWLGVTGAFVRSSGDDLPASHYLAGVRANSSFSGYQAVRAYGHALVGAAAPRSPMDGTGTGAELVVGGGFDMFVLRLQFDYVWSAVEGVRSFRAMIGGVVPLCLRGCSDKDGFRRERFAQRPQ